MKLHLKTAFLGMIALIPATLVAGTIGPNCGSCQGGIYDLSYNLISSTAGVDTLNLFLTVNTTSYTGGGLFINSVAPKIAPSLLSFSLLSAPVSMNAGSTWNTFDGGLNANGCSGSGSGFLCSESTSLGASTATALNTWTWQVQLATGSLFEPNEASSIKVLFVNNRGAKVGALVSEGISLTPRGSEVPEPATFAIAGAGLVALALIRRRR